MYLKRTKNDDGYVTSSKLLGVILVLFSITEIKSLKDAALVVCTVDGTIHTFEAWSGHRRGRHTSGSALVTSFSYDLQEEAWTTPIPKCDNETVVFDLTHSDTDGLKNDSCSMFDLFESKQRFSNADFSNFKIPSHDRQRKWKHTQIVPDLQGNIYMIEEEEKVTRSEDINEGSTQTKKNVRFKPFPVNAFDVINSPSSTCTSNHDGLSECGLVFGEKTSKVFALNVVDGSVRWIQEAKKVKNNSIEDDEPDFGIFQTVLLKRDDYIVSYVDIGSGKEKWNISTGNFFALDIPSPRTYRDIPRKTIQSLLGLEYSALDASLLDDYKPSFSDVLGVGINRFEMDDETNDNRGFNNVLNDVDETERSSFPSYIFSEDGKTLIAKDTVTGNTLWKKRMNAIVSAVYGVSEGRRWVPLNVPNVIDESHEMKSKAISTQDFGGFNLEMQKSSIDSNPATPLLPYPYYANSKVKRHEVVVYSKHAFVETQTDQQISGFWDDNTDVNLSILNNPLVIKIQVEDGIFVSWRSITKLCIFVLTTFLILLPWKLGFCFSFRDSENQLHSNTQQSSNPASEHDSSISAESRHVNVTNTISKSIFQRSLSLPSFEKSDIKHVFNLMNSSMNNMTKKKSDSETERKEATSDISESDSDNIGGVPLVRYSRFKSEFKELSCLGKGGFGTVFQCHNTFDGRTYAIKKIRIKSYVEITGMPSKHLLLKLHRVHREVKTLALLDHPNVVRYYNAWLEHDESKNNFCEVTDIESTSRINAKLSVNESYLPLAESYELKSSLENAKRTTKKSERFSHFSIIDESAYDIKLNESNATDLGFNWEMNSNESGIEKSLHSNFKNKDVCADLLTSSCKCISVGIAERNFSIDTGKKDSQSKESKDTRVKMQTYTMFIQMQLCAQNSLADFLSTPAARRGSSSVKSLEIFDIDFIFALKIFHQIVKGVKHVHEQGLIHRDLKPSNCFIDDDGIVKVGDFGLSRAVSSSNDERNEDDPFLSTEELLGREENVFHEKKEESKTAGIGTRAYASPEQMQGSDYDASSDVYSLGIMLFELCYPMYTGMEKYSIFEGLRKRRYPKQWNDDVATLFPTLHALLHAMISDVPTDRPSSMKISSEIEGLLGEYTVQSLCKSLIHQRKGCLLIRVEARVTSANILHNTIKMIKESSREVTILQYGLRGGESKAIIEFAISFPNVANSRIQDCVHNLISVLNDAEDILAVRKITEKLE